MTVSLGDSLTWQDWVRLVASELGVHGLTDDEVDWFLWERSPYPIGGPRAARPYLVAALLGDLMCPCCGEAMTSEDDARTGVCSACTERMGW